jgi:tetratricopeptide (TPR) repeat protein
MVGKYEESLIDLNFVIETRPSHKNARFNRAEILSQLGELDAAVEDYSAVIDLDPRDVAAISGRGLMLAQLGRIDESMLDLNTVVRLQPENAEAYVDRADVHAASGNWDRAAGDYRVAIGIDNQLGRAYHNVAWMMATCPEKKFRDGNLAVQAAKRAIKLEGKTHRNLDTLAAALACMGDFERAAPVLKQALALVPEGEREPLQARMALYQKRQPYHERADRSRVQLASAEEPIDE